MWVTRYRSFTTDCNLFVLNDEMNYLHERGYCFIWQCYFNFCSDFLSFFKGSNQAISYNFFSKDLIPKS